ncbi:MAG: class I SAM-dependent methyltransferase [Candidatus Kariarchaeaceae archaeon]
MINLFFGKYLKKELIGVIPDHLLDLLPNRYIRLGSIAIIRLKNELFNFQDLIGNHLLAYETRIKTVFLQKTTSGVTRRPEMEFICGDNNSITLHKEVGTKFWIDVTKHTFSPGNHSERIRMMNLIQDGEKVLDMFAAVGNLSLIAANSKKAQFLGIELAKRTYDYLVKNINENDLESTYQALNGDNRYLAPEEKFDRVIMGFFECDKLQLEVAFKAIKGHGTIHLHEAVPNHLWERVEEKVKSMAEITQSKILSITIHRQKKYSPGIDHIVADIEIQK